MKTSNTSIEEFKYLQSSVSTKIQLQLSLNSTQSHLNSTSTQTTELGTTQLNLYFSILDTYHVSNYELTIIIKNVLCFELKKLLLVNFHIGDSTSPQQKYAGTGENYNIVIAVIFYPVNQTF